MKKKPYIVMIVMVILLLISILVLPIIMDNLMGNNFPSNISNSQWVSFLGSYVGSILGGLFSIIGVFATIRYYKSQDKMNHDERTKLILSEIKKQYEVKYRFEFLEELNNMNRTLNIILDEFHEVSMLIYSSKVTNLLECIDEIIWKYFKKLSTDLNNYYNNINSIYECKLSVFYENSFIKDFRDDMDALFFMTSEGFNATNKELTVEKLEKQLLQIVNQWHLGRQINSIKDIEDWIKELSNKFLTYVKEFKQSI